MPKEAYLGINVVIREDLAAKDLIPAVEAAGMVECQPPNSLNLIVGRAVTLAELDQTLENVRAVDGVELADKSQVMHATKD